jgi:uncharacterized protein (DUF2336 family)
LWSALPTATIAGAATSKNLDRSMLTQAHVRALRDNPSWTVRSDIAAAVAADLGAAALTVDEVQIAAASLEILAHDVDRRVRQALAEHVKDSSLLPREVALALASDIEDAVAVPIIQYSPLLSDADLILYLRTGSVSRQRAVAGRKSVGTAIADQLVETGNKQIVGALLTVCEVLIARVTQTLRARLVAKHHIPELPADELMLHGREKAVSAVIAYSGVEAAERLTAHLHARRRRSCCGGCAMAICAFSIAPWQRLP